MIFHFFAGLRNAKGECSLTYSTPKTGRRTPRITQQAIITLNTRNSVDKASYRRTPEMDVRSETPKTNPDPKRARNAAAAAFRYS